MSYLGVFTGLSLVEAVSPIVFSLVFLFGGGLSTLLLVLLVPNDVNRTVSKLPPLVPSVRILSRSKKFKLLFCNRILVGTATSIFGLAASLYVLIGFDLTTTTEYVAYIVVLVIVSDVLGTALIITFN